MMARYTQTEIAIWNKAIEQLFHWYDREAVLEFLKAVGPDEGGFADAVSKLARHKTEPGSS
jgi:hypothetical protein